MRIEQIEVRLLSLPMCEPFAAAHGTSARREITVVRVDADTGSGWGECAALSEPTYTAEWAAGAFEVLAGDLAPRLLAFGALREAFRGTRGNQMAKAALEMAMLDVELRAGGRSLAGWLGADRDRVPAGAAIGLGTPESVADRAGHLASEGFGRIKLKITPGRDRKEVAAVRSRCPDLEVQLDANGSYPAGHGGVGDGPDPVDLLVGLAAEFAVTALEQPFAPGDMATAGRLVSELARREVACLVVADEAARSDRAVRQLHDQGALTAVSVKPSRLGGLAAALRVQRLARRRGLALTPGGMVETGLGRHALAAVAAIPGFTLTGDVSPARRWLAVDPWPDLTMVDGHILVPDGPGVAPPPDPDVLDAHTVLVRAAR